MPRIKNIIPSISSKFLHHSELRVQPEIFLQLIQSNIAVPKVYYLATLRKNFINYLYFGCILPIDKKKIGGNWRSMMRISDKNMVNIRLEGLPGIVYRFPKIRFILSTIYGVQNV